MIDSKALLADLQEQVRRLEDDLATQLVEVAGLNDLLHGEWEAERRARRTAAEWPDWRRAQLTQIAVAWVLGTVFLRWCEDNHLIDPVLSGPGDRLAAAEDAQLEHYRRHPEHNDGDWLAEQFEVLRATDAGRLLFDPDHNPMYWVPISHDAAKALVAFWRTGDGERPRHDFEDRTWDTRFLGDLYQDLSEDAKKRYALLQTPRFVERFILDRTLKPAMEEFGLDGLRLIDPACGSGHFLLGAFERLVAAWREQAPAMDGYELVRRSLGSVHGADMNPFAVAIARFRLLVAALQVAGVTTLADAARQAWRPVVACTDSLLPIARQESFTDIDNVVGYRARWEDVQEFSDLGLLNERAYHAVVGNPPYIPVEDSAARATYRSLYRSCGGKFISSVPFAEKFFSLAKRGDGETSAGFVGQITANSFMKRQWGKKLVQEFFPNVDLQWIVDTSGVPIPGSGVTTVILFGRNRRPTTDVVKCVLGLTGEPGAAPGPAWLSIISQVATEGGESLYSSFEKVGRSRLAKHPWSIGGGGATELTAILESTGRMLAAIADRVGVFGMTNADDV